MVDDDAHDAVEELEARIEALGETIERCRKISLAAKLAVAAGAGWTMLVVLTLVPFDPATFIAAIAIAIGGVVLLGSNATTWTQTEVEMQRAQAQRADLIEHMHLSVIGGNAPTLH